MPFEQAAFGDLKVAPAVLTVLLHAFLLLATLAASPREFLEQHCYRAVIGAHAVSSKADTENNTALEAGKP